MVVSCLLPSSCSFLLLTLFLGHFVRPNFHTAYISINGASEIHVTHFSFLVSRDLPKTKPPAPLSAHSHFIMPIKMTLIAILSTLPYLMPIAIAQDPVKAELGDLLRCSSDAAYPVIKPNCAPKSVGVKVSTQDHSLADSFCSYIAAFAVMLGLVSFRLRHSCNLPVGLTHNFSCSFHQSVPVLVSVMTAADQMAYVVAEMHTAIPKITTITWHTRYVARSEPVIDFIEKYRHMLIYLAVSSTSLAFVNSVLLASLAPTTTVHSLRLVLRLDVSDGIDSLRSSSSVV